MHCRIGFDLMTLQIIKALGKSSLGVEITPALGAKHDAKGVFRAWRELERVIVDRLDRRLVGTARQSFGLLPALKQLLHVVGGELQQSAKLLGQFARVASCEGILLLS